MQKLIEEQAGEHRSAQRADLSNLGLELRKALAKQADDSQARCVALRHLLEEVDVALRAELRRVAEEYHERHTASLEIAIEKSEHKLVDRFASSQSKHKQELERLWQDLCRAPFD